MFGGAVVANTARCRPVSFKSTGHFDGPCAALSKGRTGGEGYLPQNWDVESGDGDMGESWDGAECVFGHGRVPPMEANLLELIRIRRPQSRRAAQSRLLPYPDLSRQGTNSSLSATEADPSVEAAPPISDFGPLRCDDDWELLSLYSEWDGCSVQSI